VVRRPVTTQTTLHELVAILTKQAPKKQQTSIELDYSIEVKPEFYRRSVKVRQATPEHKSGLSVLYHDIKDRITQVDQDLETLSVPESIKHIVLAIKLIIELDSLKSHYLEGPSAKLHQHVQLDGSYAPALLAKLSDSKLSSLYSKIFTKPSRILGQSFPLLCRLLCARLPELFDFNTRYNFFKHLQFEPTRAMYFIYQANKPAFKEIPGSKIGKLKRKKLKVSRDRIFEDARLVFSLSDFQSVGATQQNVLEFDFENEEGSGLGPTLEFYSLLADDFKKRGKAMWRDTDDFSLFPKPCSPASASALGVAEDRATWRILGAICGRSILDERIFDMRFSEVFWKVVMGQRVGLSDLRNLNGGLMKTMSDMQALANKYQLSLGKTVGNPASLEELKASLSFNGVRIEDLCLLFTLPGFDNYELLPGGLRKEVTLDNLELYVDLVVKTYLVDSILPSVEAFREGLNTVRPAHPVRPPRETRLLPAARNGARRLRHQARAVDCPVPQRNHRAHARLPRRQPDLPELPRPPRRLHRRPKARVPPLHRRRAQAAPRRPQEPLAQTHRGEETPPKRVAARRRDPAVRDDLPELHKAPRLLLEGSPPQEVLLSDEGRPEVFYLVLNN